MTTNHRTCVRAIAASVLFGMPVAPAWAQSGTTATQTVDAMNQLWGRHPETRANHAKGVVVEGSFTPTPEAATLSKASLFEGRPVPLTLRFSDSTGLPTIPDGAEDANPHGLSLKFHLADGGEMDGVSNSLAFFPVATGEEFRDLLQALAASGPDAAKPTKAEQFIAAHPSVPKAFASATTPTSYARETYKLPQRLAKQPIAFHAMAQLADPGDQTKDPTQPWPADRRMVDLGTITITKAVPDSAAAEKALLLLPNRLPSGIEASDDPLIGARVQAYLISVGRRTR